MRKGDIWWATLEEPRGSEPGYRRPVVVISSNEFNESMIKSIIVEVFTSDFVHYFTNHRTMPTNDRNHTAAKEGDADAIAAEIEQVFAKLYLSCQARVKLGTLYIVLEYFRNIRHKKLTEILRNWLVRLAPAGVNHVVIQGTRGIDSHTPPQKWRTEFDMPGNDTPAPVAAAIPAPPPERPPESALENPYSPPKSAGSRAFSTPIIVPLSVIGVMTIYLGYAYLFMSSGGEGLFPALKSISFELFLLCEVGIIFGAIHNKRLLDRFMKKHPVIDGPETLEALKPVARTNMYSALSVLVLLAIGALSAIMTILHRGLIEAALVVALSLATALIMKWYNQSEEKIKQIRTTDTATETQLRAILECWLHKPFPDF